MNLKVIPNRQFFAIVEHVIGSGESIEIKIKGSSMYPTLVENRHKVVLSPFSQTYLATGMIALFRYKGRHVLHRLVDVDGELLTFQGDNLPNTRETVREEDIIAFVEFIVTPKGKIIDCKKQKFNAITRMRLYGHKLRCSVMRKVRAQLS